MQVTQTSSPSEVKEPVQNTDKNNLITELFDRMCKKEQTGCDNAAKMGVGVVVISAVAFTVVACTLASPFLIGGLILVAGIIFTAMAFAMYDDHKDKLSVYSFMRDSYTPDAELMKMRVANFIEHSDESTREQMKNMVNGIQKVISKYTV